MRRKNKIINPEILTHYFYEANSKNTLNKKALLFIEVPSYCSYIYISSSNCYYTLK